MTFGTPLRVSVIALGCKVNYAEMADLAGRLAAKGILIDRSAVSRIENQTRYLMDYEVRAIAGALKVSVAWLFGEAM